MKLNGVRKEKTDIYNSWTVGLFAVIYVMLTYIKRCFIAPCTERLFSEQTLNLMLNVLSPAGWSNTGRPTAWPPRAWPSSSDPRCCGPRRRRATSPCTWSIRTRSWSSYCWSTRAFSAGRILKKKRRKKEIESKRCRPLLSFPPPPPPFSLTELDCCGPIGCSRSFKEDGTAHYGVLQGVEGVLSGRFKSVKLCTTDFVFLLLCTHRPCNVFGGVTRGWIWVFRFVFLVFFFTHRLKSFRHWQWKATAPKKRKRKEKLKKKYPGNLIASLRLRCGFWKLEFKFWRQRRRGGGVISVMSL